MKKNLEEKHLTVAQKYNNQFEDISTQIVKLFFKDTNAIIKKTKDSKDGGYDILVEYSDGMTTKKIYFECKLRSGNLNLRDIAANLIIAFNEGAVALGIITNYDYTEQSNENISTFYEHTFLNIKIIIGEDIRKLFERYKLTIPAELNDIIASKKTKRKTEYRFLRIDLNKNNIYDQFLNKEDRGNSDLIPYIVKKNQTLFNKAEKYITNGNIICIQGFLGVGKTSFIKSLLIQSHAKEIHIVADNYSAQSQLLLCVFLDLWGIPVHNIVRDFSDEIIEKIASIVEEKSKDSRTGKIVRTLLNNSELEDIAKENYNWLICDYLINQLMLHKESQKYVFYIENAEKATEEIQNLLLYICKLLKRNNIACIIEKNDSEFELMESDALDIFYKGVQDIALPIDLDYLKSDEAGEFVHEELADYPEILRDAVIKKGGVRLLTLNTLIAFVKEKWKSDSVQANLMEELDCFTQNDVPFPIRSLLELYFKKFPDLFHFFVFFNGKIPFEWVDILAEDKSDVVDNLLNLKFLDIDDECLIVANELIMEQIKIFSEKHVFSVRRAAQKLLTFLNSAQKDLYIECRIQAYYYIKDYDSVYPLMKMHMTKLWNDRQYSAFLDYGNLALTMLNKDAIEMRLRLIISMLKVWVVKKQTNARKAEALYQKFRELLQFLTEDQAYYQMIYDYFYSKQLFKNCDFHNTLDIVQPYYERYLEGKTKHTQDEWEEKLCVVYALSVKELYGNEMALPVFEKLIRLNPNSFHFRLELLSHRQCMNFYQNPEFALNCSNEMFNMFKEQSRDDYPLPYHEYVDRAMCALCAKKLDDAMAYSDEAIQVLESNGIMPALGRAYNIKGCTQICLGKIENAESCLKEACFIMDEMGYQLYSWRSRLNLIQLKLTYQADKIRLNDITALLDQTYDQFRNIYLEKIKQMASQESFPTTREYFALLMFGHIYKKLDKDITTQVVEEFLTGTSSQIYLKALNQLEDEKITITEFTDCPYSHGKYIFMIA